MVPHQAVPYEIHRDSTRAQALTRGLANDGRICLGFFCRSPVFDSRRASLADAPKLYDRWVATVDPEHRLLESALLVDGEVALKGRE
jgi:hypothetical protein